MSKDEAAIKSVAIIGAGAAGVMTAVALKAENYFETIRVFERKPTAGGTWIYDADPSPSLPIYPGRLPPETDPPLDIPEELPQVRPHNTQERYASTPIYDSLTTNVPDIAMCFSDARFAYGPFVPHYVPRQYLENYVSQHKVDEYLVLNTTVEDVSELPPRVRGGQDRWKLVLRKYDQARHVDVWWEEEFDAVVLANGHYAVPFVPEVQGLEAYLEAFPGRVVHSKHYRSPLVYASKKVLVVGNSASGHDVTADLATAARLPVYQSRRSPSRWDGGAPPPGVEWKPVVKEFGPGGGGGGGRIVFEDDTYLDDVDAVIYCTGYQPSFPFWRAGGAEAGSAHPRRPLWDYARGRLHDAYWHTFFPDLPTLAAVGIPRTLTFRSFEYQAVAIARLWSGRSAKPLPPPAAQRAWARARAELARREGRGFHDLPWEGRGGGEAREWLQGLFEIAGLNAMLGGDGRVPPALTRELVWALENVRKYPEPGRDGEGGKDGGEDNGDSGDACGNKAAHGMSRQSEEGDTGEWILVHRPHKMDLLGFI